MTDYCDSCDRLEEENNNLKQRISAAQGALIGAPTGASKSASHIYDEFKGVITDQLKSLEEKLPFVGLRYYIETLLPDLVGHYPRATRQLILEEMIEDNLVEIYKVDNPGNEEFQTSAIRLI